MINRFKEIFCLETERLILILWQPPVLTKKSSLLVVSLDESRARCQNRLQGKKKTHKSVTKHLGRTAPQRPFVLKDISAV